MDHYGLQVFKDAMVLSLSQSGDCYHRSRDCKSIRHTTPLTQQICNVYAREPSGLQASVKKDGCPVRPEGV